MASVLRRLGAGRRELRRERNPSQVELAARSSVHRVTIAGIESGRDKVTLLVLERLANVWRVDLSTLVGVHDRA